MQNYWKYHVIILASFLHKFFIVMFVLSVAKYVLFSPPLPSSATSCHFHLLPHARQSAISTNNKKNVPCQKAGSTRTSQALNIGAFFPHFALDSEIYFRQMRFSFGNYFIPGLWVFLFGIENWLPFFFWISHTYWSIATKKLSEEYGVVLGLSWESIRCFSQADPALLHRSVCTPCSHPLWKIAKSSTNT